MLWFSRFEDTTKLDMWIAALQRIYQYALLVQHHNAQIHISSDATPVNLQEQFSRQSQIALPTDEYPTEQDLVRVAAQYQMDTLSA